MSDKKYHVYGLGAALVDTEIEVTDKDLSKLGVEKGWMTLVDEDRQRELVDDLQDHLTASRRASGGSAANTIIAVTGFGGRTFFTGKVADDDNGHFYLNDMAEAGVDHAGKDGLPEGITGRCLVMITPDAERSMNTFLGISETLAPEDLSPEAIADSQYLYVEGYLATSETGRAAAVAARNHARKSGTRFAFSLSDPGIVANFRDQLKEIVDRRVDLLFCNREEALAWTGRETLRDAAEEMSDWADSYVITLGKEGALIYDDGELHTIAGEAVTAVDSNGAGDMFAGAYLYGITQGWPAREAGEFACLAAATVVSQFGPRLPLRQYWGVLDSFNLARQGKAD
jgi:sugar/nucleoside kinase (ribokinase family)